MAAGAFCAPLPELLLFPPSAAAVVLEALELRGRIAEGSEEIKDSGMYSSSSPPSLSNEEEEGPAGRGAFILDDTQQSGVLCRIGVSDMCPLFGLLRFSLAFFPFPAAEDTFAQMVLVLLVSFRKVVGEWRGGSNKVFSLSLFFFNFSGFFTNIFC